jgi:hypothetical protein
MDRQPEMRVCHMVECGGLEQPHSFDDCYGALDCDGPCSIRRQAEWLTRNEAKHADEPVEEQPQQQPTNRMYAEVHRETYLPLYKAYIAVLEQVAEGSTEAVKTARSICNLMNELQHSTYVLWDTDMMDTEVQELEANLFSEGTFPPRFGLYPDN